MFWLLNYLLPELIYQLRGRYSHDSQHLKTLGRTGVQVQILSRMQKYEDNIKVIYFDKDLPGTLRQVGVGVGGAQACRARPTREGCQSPERTWGRFWA